MTLLEFGPVPGLGDADGPRSATPRKAYDDLAGSTMLRRAGKSAARVVPLRGDQASTLLASRHKTEGEDRLGRQLREFYQAMLSEPVPERLVALVNALESKNR
jgi:hypothetical protein